MSNIIKKEIITGSYAQMDQSDIGNPEAHVRLTGCYDYKTITIVGFRIYAGLKTYRCKGCENACPHDTDHNPFTTPRADDK